MAASLRAATSPSQAKSSVAPVTPSLPKPRRPQLLAAVQPSTVMPAAASKPMPASTATGLSSTPDRVRSLSSRAVLSLRSSR